VPRIGSRIDAVVIAGPAVVVIEFKVGETRVNAGDCNQAWDYALDLKNFHLASHSAPVIPVLVPSEMGESEPSSLEQAADGVFRPLSCNAGKLGNTLQRVLKEVGQGTLDGGVWARSP